MLTTPSRTAQQKKDENTLSLGTYLKNPKSADLSFAEESLKTWESKSQRLGNKKANERTLNFRNIFFKNFRKLRYTYALIVVTFMSTNVQGKVQKCSPWKMLGTWGRCWLF